jgi:hypothetical protein
VLTWYTNGRKKELVMISAKGASKILFIFSTIILYIIPKRVLSSFMGLAMKKSALYSSSNNYRKHYTL